MYFTYWPTLTKVGNVAELLESVRSLDSYEVCLNVMLEDLFQMKDFWTRKEQRTYASKQNTLLIIIPNTLR